MKLLNARRFHRADALVPGEDITGNMIVPIVERLTGLSPQAINLLNCPMTFERGIQGDKF